MIKKFIMWILKDVFVALRRDMSSDRDILAEVVLEEVDRRLALAIRPEVCLCVPSDVKIGDAVDLQGIRGTVVSDLGDSVLVRLYDGAKIEIVKQQDI